MKTITTLALLMSLFLFGTDAEATLVCEPSEILAGAFRCDESIDNAGQYVWSANEFDGTLVPYDDPPNAAMFYCRPKESWPPENVGGVLVQGIQQVTIQVAMPHVFLGMVLTHTTTVECRGQSPEPSQLAKDPCRAKDESTPASTITTSTGVRRKGMQSTRGFFGGVGRVIGDFGGGSFTFGGYGSVYELNGMDLGNDYAPPRIARCRNNDYY